MKLLLTVFFIRKIYFKQTVKRIVFTYAVCFLILFILVIADLDSNPVFAPLNYKYNTKPALTFLLVVVSYFFIRTLLRTLIVNQRLKQPTDPLSSQVTSEIKNSAISDELEVVDKIRLIKEFKDARLYDAVFNFYGQTRYGQYLSKQAFYTVYEAKLKRRLPNIIFDSKISKGEQFKILYLKAQRLSVQGGFDKHFTTYAPQSYDIDTLSFISPEVMEALLLAKDYDIEIIGDRLLLYAPLIDISETKKLVSIGEYITAHINDNVDNYRDDRLSGEQRIKDVSILGRSLLNSPRRYIPVLILSGILILAIIVIAIKEKSFYYLYNQISFLVYIIFGSHLASIIKIVRENNRITRLYLTSPVRPKNRL